MIIAHLLNTRASLVKTLALMFIAARALHVAFYLANQATLRSLAWFVGFCTVIAIFVVA